MWKVQSIYSNHYFVGVGEAYDKRASAQMAALDVLLKMKVRESSSWRVAPFGILPGSRVSPRVFEDLNQFCFTNGFQAPRFITMPNLSKDKPAIEIECFVGVKKLSRKTPQQTSQVNEIYTKQTCNPSYYFVFYRGWHWRTTLWPEAGCVHCAGGTDRCQVSKRISCIWSCVYVVQGPCRNRLQASHVRACK